MAKDIMTQKIEKVQNFTKKLPDYGVSTENLSTFKNELEDTLRTLLSLFGHNLRSDPEYCLDLGKLLLEALNKHAYDLPLEVPFRADYDKIILPITIGLYQEFDRLEDLAESYQYNSYESSYESYYVPYEPPQSSY